MNTNLIKCQIGFCTLPPQAYLAETTMHAAGREGNADGKIVARAAGLAIWEPTLLFH